MQPALHLAIFDFLSPNDQVPSYTWANEDPKQIQIKAWTQLDSFL